jgi:molybdate transport system regulatory protein
MLSLSQRQREGLTGMKVAYKIWIDQKGKAFGDGPYDLLKGVEKTGSLHKVADQMGMAYSKAWTLIRTLEQRLGFLLLDRKVGGRAGGGSQITPQAKELMLRYGRFREEAREAIEKIYQKHFVFYGKPRPERGDAAHKGRRVKDAPPRPEAEAKRRESRMPQRRSR